MLGTAQPHAFGAELARGAAIVGRLGIGTHLEAADLVRPDYQRAEIARQLGLDGGDGARHHLAGRAVDRDRLAFRDLALADPHHASLHVDREHPRARDARPPHAAPHHRDWQSTSLNSSHYFATRMPYFACNT